MRLWRGCLLVLVCVLTASAAHAQASLTGVVRDTSGAVLPGVTVEASSAALIERSRTAVTDGTGQYRIVDLRFGHVRPDVHPAGVQHRQAGRGRAARHVDRRRQRGHAGRQSRGNDHRYQRIAGRRRAERPPSDDGERRYLQRAPIGTGIRGGHAADPVDHHPGQPEHVRHGRPGHAGDVRVRRRRRPAERGASAGGRYQHRCIRQWRRGVTLHRRHDERSGESRSRRRAGSGRRRSADPP